MDTNISDVNPNITLHQVINFLNLSISAVNDSEITQNHLHNNVDKEAFTVFQHAIYIVGPLIVLSNLPVVVSSGLFIKNDLRPKSTYLLLGNVSLADIFIGICLIFTVAADNYERSNPLCLLETGFLMGASMVSGYSTVLIIIDRYIYILYGLYYKIWINANRVRIAILLTWIFGLTIGFLPATGLVNSNLLLTCCSYLSLFSDSLILLNAFIGMLPFAVVVILYSKILIKALKVVQDLNTNIKVTKQDDKAPDNSKIISRCYKTDLSTINQSVEIPKIAQSPNSARTSLNSNSNKPEEEDAMQPANTDNKAIITNIDDIHMKRISKPARNSAISDSSISVCTIETEIADNNRESENIPEHENSRSNRPDKKIENINKIILKPTASNKWRAITIVLVTFGGFIITCMPTYIALLFYVFCEDKITNVKCLYIRYLIDGPFNALAYVNALLNPLIYAWWHKGFRKSLKKTFKKYLNKA